MALDRLLLMVTTGIIVGGLVKNCQAKDVSGAPCAVPSFIKKNFHNSIGVLNATNRTLSCEIHSDTPLKGELSWRYENSRFPARIKHSEVNGSCSASSNTTCKVSNLTLINVIQGEYDGNYSLTAENDCGIATVYVIVNIMVLPRCIYNHNYPPQLEIPPPQFVETVEGDSDITITAQYEGSKGDPNLGVYWCVYFTQYNYHCYKQAKDIGNYVVRTDGCTFDSDCCHLTVILKIRSISLNLSHIILQSMVIWLDSKKYMLGNSTLVVNPWPTLVSQLPSQYVELNEGEAINLTCTYNASTNPNVTITTWKFKEEILDHNSSHYTVITNYGGSDDPLYHNRVFSRLIISDVIVYNSGTYTCQCVYNSTTIASHEDNVLSGAASFHLKVNPGKKHDSKTYFLWTIIGIVVGAIVVVLIFSSFIALILVCFWRKPKNQNRSDNERETLCDKSETPRDEREAPPIDRETPPGERETPRDERETPPDERETPPDERETPPGERETPPDERETSPIEREMLREASPDEREVSPDEIETPPNETSLLLSGNKEMTNYAAINNQYDKNGCTSKPKLSYFPTGQGIESIAEHPRRPNPAATQRPPVDNRGNLGVSYQPNGAAPTASNCHDRILDSIAPDFTTHINMESLLPFLQQHRLITRDEIHHLTLVFYSSGVKAQKLLDYLKTKGADTLQRVLCSLKSADEHTGHKEVADKLKQLMQNYSIDCDSCPYCESLLKN